MLGWCCRGCDVGRSCEITGRVESRGALDLTPGTCRGCGRRQPVSGCLTCGSTDVIPESKEIAR